MFDGLPEEAQEDTSVHFIRLQVKSSSKNAETKISALAQKAKSTPLITMWKT